MNVDADDGIVEDDEEMAKREKPKG